MFQKNFVEKIKTLILCSVFFFFENLAVYKIMWKNNVERGRPQVTIWHMCIEYCINKARNTHSQVVYYSLFSTAIMVERTPFNITLYVHCLPALSHLNFVR